MDGGATVFRKLHTPGFEGWTISRYRQTSGRTPGGRPRAHHRGPGRGRRRRRGDAPEPVAVRALLRRPRALDGPRPGLQRLHRRAVHPLLRPARADGPGADHRHRRRRGRDRAGRGGRVPGRPAALHPADALLVPGPRSRVGRGPGQRPAHLHPHPDGRGEGQRPGVHDPQGRHGVRRPGQPADDREDGLEADDHPVDLQHDRPPAGDVRADRRRGARALPGPALRPHRVQRQLAGVAGRGHGQVLDHRHRPGRRLVARATGTTTGPPRTSPTWPSSSASTRSGPTR